MIDPARGKMMEQYALPAGGPLDPVIVLTYNDAYRGNANEFPDGWTSNYRRRIDTLTYASKTAVISGTGTAYQYTAATAPNYTAPDQALNWLVDDSPSGWIETQPDGLKYYYDSSGKLTRLTNHMGKVWTLSYASGFLSFIENPAAKRTTFSYHVSTGELDPRRRRAADDIHRQRQPAHEDHKPRAVRDAV
jgi:YD repeat-containing protein